MFSEMKWRLLTLLLPFAAACVGQTKGRPQHVSFIEIGESKQDDAGVDWENMRSVLGDVAPYSAETTQRRMYAQIRQRIEKLYWSVYREVYDAPNRLRASAFFSLPWETRLALEYDHIGLGVISRHVFIGQVDRHFGPFRTLVSGVRVRSMLVGAPQGNTLLALGSIGEEESPAMFVGATIVLVKANCRWHWLAKSEPINQQQLAASIANRASREMAAHREFAKRFSSDVECH